MPIPFIHVPDWSWHRCSEEDEVYKLKTVRRNPWFQAVPHRCGALHLCLKLLSFRFSAEKPGMMFKLGAPVFRANLDNFVAWISWIHCLNLTRKVFFFLGDLKLRSENWVINMYGNLTPEPKPCKVLYGFFFFFFFLRSKRLGNTQQMLLDIGRLEPTHWLKPLFKSQGNFPVRDATFGPQNQL